MDYNLLFPSDIEMMSQYCEYKRKSLSKGCLCRPTKRYLQLDKWPTKDGVIRPAKIDTPPDRYMIHVLRCKFHCFILFSILNKLAIQIPGNGKC